MTYDLSNTLDRERFKTRTNALWKRGAKVELTDVSHCSTAQNSYLHLIISIFAMETGNTAEYVKTEYFKRKCSPDIFVVRQYDKLINSTTERMRSCASLTSEETSLAIDRFKRWSAENGIYLPAPEDRELIAQARMELGRVRQWI